MSLLDGGSTGKVIESKRGADAACAVRVVDEVLLSRLGTCVIVRSYEKM